MSSTLSLSLLPAPGSWVADLSADRASSMPRIAQVKDSYRDDGGAGYLDLVFYRHTGERIGRVSPPMGGPRGFEPCCGAEYWVEIQRPDFDLLASHRYDFGGFLVPVVRLSPST